MTDPRRLTEAASGATWEETELLHAARGADLGAHDRRAIWSQIQAQLPLATASPARPDEVANGPSAAGNTAGSAGGGSAAGAGIAGLSKTLALSALGLALVGGGYALLPTMHPAAPRPRTGTPSTATSARVEAQRPEPSNDSSPLTHEAPLEASPRAGAPQERKDALVPPARPGAASAPRMQSPNAQSASLLREESAAVLAARRAVQRGDWGGALQQMEDMQRRFPGGALAQDREALSIEALAKSGARDVAARRAQAFLRKYPKSPYTSDIARYVGH